MTIDSFWIIRSAVSQCKCVILLSATTWNYLRTDTKCSSNRSHELFIYSVIRGERVLQRPNARYASACSKHEVADAHRTSHIIVLITLGDSILLNLFCIGTYSFILQPRPMVCVCAQCSTHRMVFKVDMFITGREKWNRGIVVTHSITLYDIRY